MMLLFTILISYTFTRLRKLSFNMKHIVLEPLAIESQENDHVRSCIIRRVDDGAQVDEKKLWFQFSKSIEPPEDKDCDSYLLAVLMDAMGEGRDIIVKGSVSFGLLSNLTEYQAAWNKWLPDIYSIIDIKVDAAKENGHPVSGTICAFSGGVDSMFSVWRHSQGKNSYRSQNIKLCSLVHGFDIPLPDTAAFDNVTQNAITALYDIGIKIGPIKTNYREISRAKWIYAHAAALVAALANFKKVAGTCLIGSGFAYNYIVTPWGSTPITDFLLSSDDFIVIHDGASHTRTEKVKEISEWKVGIANLRVCWQGAMKDRNCGKCEKCVRTKLCFLASGRPIPCCFDDADIDFKGILLKNDYIRGEWKQIIDYANRNGVKGAWLKEAKKVIKKKRMTDLILPKGGSIRLAAKNIRKKIKRH